MTFMSTENVFPLPITMTSPLETSNPSALALLRALKTESEYFWLNSPLLMSASISGSPRVYFGAQNFHHGLFSKEILASFSWNRCMAFSELSKTYLLLTRTTLCITLGTIFPSSSLERK